jgi:EthD domain
MRRWLTQYRGCAVICSPISWASGPRPDIPTTDVEVDGIAETWYDDLAAMERANASAEAKALHADGALFIGGIKSFITEEKVIIPPERE